MSNDLKDGIAIPKDNVDQIVYQIIMKIQNKTWGKG